MLLTIFTPTYNRHNTLPRLYNSLCQQDCQDFEWLVVDDGSTDGTENLISEYREKSSFPIIYIKQTNGGKHTAHNTALKYAKGEYFFTVDSDDWLIENSISKINQIIHCENQVKSSFVAGLLALKSYENREIIGKRFSADNFTASLYELEHTGNNGERTVIIKTVIARQYPFPIIDGERFVTESVIYDRIAQTYKFFVSNEVLTVCEYQPNGLSSNPKQLMCYNPGGYVIYFVQRADSTDSLTELIKYLIQVNAFNIIYKGSTKLPSVTKHKILYWITKPLGWIASIHYKSFFR